MNAAPFLVLICLLSSWSLRASDPVTPGPELVVNPTFITDGEAPPQPWQAWLPEWTSARITLAPSPEGLIASATNQAFAVGGVSQPLRGIQGGRSYAVEVRADLVNLPQPHQSALVRITWQRDGEALHPAGALVRGPFTTGEPAVFRDLLVAPVDADSALLSLEVKWPRGGSVRWRSASVRLGTEAPTRKARLGTAYLRPEKSTPEQNLTLWCDQIAAAGRLGLDIVCLSEAILSVGTQAATREIAETIPGPTSERLGAAARQHRLWVVAGVMEREGATLFNTAVLFDRQGRIAGRYRKVHLPREEWQKGITPGTDYPVFQTDFGTVGLMVCYDYFFPETVQILAQNGAEIVFAPTWGTTFADREGRVEGQTIFRVRARDNGVFLVTSVYDGDSLVIDPLGRVLASSQGQTGVVWAEADLDQREPLWWVGHWRSIGPRDRMPETYQPLSVPLR